MDIFYNEGRGMKGGIWAVEVMVHDEWRYWASAKAPWVDDDLRSCFESWRAKCSAPCRVKAYVRYSDVLDQQRAEEYERLWRTDGNRL